MPEIKRISYSHDALANWLIMNPEKTLRECADAFGYTQAWLSTIIHSDAFKAHLAGKQEKAFGYLMQGLPEKMGAAAEVAIEKLTRKIEDSEDGKFLLDAADKLLHRMGYAPKATPLPAAGGGNVTLNQQNVFLVDKGDLAAARQSIKQLAEKATVDAEAVALDVVGQGVPNG